MDESLFTILMIGPYLSSFLGEFLIFTATIVTATVCKRRRLRPVAAWTMCGAFGGYLLCGIIYKLMYLAVFSFLGEAPRRLVAKGLSRYTGLIFEMGLGLAALACLVGVGVAILQFRPIPEAMPAAATAVEEN